MTAQLIGYSSLQGRLRAMQSPTIGAGMMAKLAVATVANAKRMVAPHRQTGDLERSIHVGEVAPTYAEVRASSAHAAYLEMGTKPHPIDPVSKMVLAWAATAAGRRLTGSLTAAARRGSPGLGGGGGIRRVGSVGPSSGPVIFARHVNHPGTKADPYMVPAATQAIAEAHLEDIVVAAWNRGG